MQREHGLMPSHLVRIWLQWSQALVTRCRSFWAPAPPPVPVLVAAVPLLVLLWSTGGASPSADMAGWAWRCLDSRDCVLWRRVWWVGEAEVKFGFRTGSQTKEEIGGPVPMEAPSALQEGIIADNGRA